MHGIFGGESEQAVQSPSSLVFESVSPSYFVWKPYKNSKHVYRQRFIGGFPVPPKPNYLAGVLTVSLYIPPKSQFGACSNGLFVIPPCAKKHYLARVLTVPRLFRQKANCVLWSSYNYTVLVSVNDGGLQNGEPRTVLSNMFYFHYKLSDFGATMQIDHDPRYTNRDKYKIFDAHIL